MKTKCVYICTSLLLFRPLINLMKFYVKLIMRAYIIWICMISGCRCHTRTSGASGRGEVRSDGPGASGAPGGEGEARVAEAPPAHRRVHPDDRRRGRHLLHSPWEATWYVHTHTHIYIPILCSTPIKIHTSINCVYKNFSFSGCFCTDLFCMHACSDLTYIAWIHL